MEMLSYLCHPLRLSPYPPRCGFYWATDSSSQPAPLWLLPACLPAEESAERGMRLHIQQTAHSSQGLNAQRSVGAVGKIWSHLKGFTHSERDATVYLGVECVWGGVGGYSMSESQFRGSACQNYNMAELQGGVSWGF